MATSGQMQGNHQNIGGTSPNFFFINWQLAGQNEDGNYSAINWQAYYHYSGSDAQLDNAVVNSNVGTHYHNGGRVKNYAATFTHRDHHIASGSFNIGHDGNGNQNINFNGGVDVFQTGRSQGSQTWSLPGLYQAIGFNDIQIHTITDVSFKVYCAVNRTANLLQLSVDGGGWVTYHSGNFGSVTVTVGSAANPLSSGQQHSVRLRIRRASNGWITDSGTYFPTTLDQGKFFSLGLAGGL